MANEFEYKNEDFQLIAELGSGTLQDNDYIRVIVYPSEAIDSIVTINGKRAIFYASFNENIMEINTSPFTQGDTPYTKRLVGSDYNDFQIFENPDGNIYIKPNEIFNKFELPQGDYKIQIDFLNQLNPISPQLGFPYYFEEFDFNGDGAIDTLDLQAWNANGRADIAEYLLPFTISDTTNDIPKASDEGVEPNPPELFIPSSEGPIYKFLIKQISTSRKEVRIELANTILTNNSPIITNLQKEFNNAEPEFLEDTDETSDTYEQFVIPNPNYKYQFKHVLNVGDGNHIPILNYQFDKLTNGKDNQSLILKLYEPIPIEFNNLDYITIEKEVLTTQIQNTFYFSDVPDVYMGNGLEEDVQENWINYDGNNIEYQNYNELTSSINQITLESIISKSEYQYDNLNTNFTKFENHTFFGSAKKKLVNFNTKVETIQEYYSEISSSLSLLGETTISSSIFLIQKRKNLFNKINKEIQTFTPYERFLYYDGQNKSTASAPGLGKNYAYTMPIQTHGGTTNILNKYDGFDTVYKRTSKGSSQPAPDVSLFGLGKYQVHEKPFFNYSGSIYLSFLAKGDIANSPLSSSINQHLVTGNTNNGFFLPVATAFTASLSNPRVTGSEYRRFVFEESRSYFAPNTLNNDMGELTIEDFQDINSSTITILNGIIKTGSAKIKDSTGLYPTTVVSESASIPFFGSVMPAGNIFNIFFKSGSALRQMLITDVKVSLKDPRDVLPFDNIYHTSTVDWTNWYNDMLTKAETFDTDNIHSLENNLPLYIQESSEYNDMKDFLLLQGEQYDLIRNHIDSLGTINKRGYKKTDSPPDNILPMLLNNMGWQAINPFSGSLADSLGSYLSGVTSIDDIKNNTWRKTLNNLIYIYKSKGTKNAVRGLLNTYGYPPDVLEFQEFGGSTEGLGGSDFLNNTPPVPLKQDYDAGTSAGIFGFVESPKKLHQHVFSAPKSLHNTRVLSLDWWANEANLNTIEYVYRHSNTTNTQIMLESTGSSNQTLWDLRLVPSVDGKSGSFAFRLNDSNTGSLAIANNAVSMSTEYVRLNDGELWNVMLQRMTSSISGSGTNEYKLHSSLQDKQKIKSYTIASMSVSGGLVGSSTAGGKGFFANQNWPSTGSRHYLTGSNLLVGTSVTGSFSEVKGWNTALSISKFRQHTLNKFSSVGNSINSHREELVYHFKLNENYTTSSISSSTQMLTIVDSAPKTTLTTDYSFRRSGSFYTGSIVYGVDTISVINFTTQDNLQKQNDKNILIKPKKRILGDLSPTKAGVDSLINPISKKPKYKTSRKLELFRSPQSFVDNFILDKLSGYNFETLYGNPISYYSQSYNEFDTFREEFFKAHPITVDVNKFVRSHENIINNSIVEGIKKLVPARSTFSDRNSNFGVEIKPTILEKQKYENKYHSIEVNPNTATGSIGILSIKDYLSGAKTGSLHRNTTGLNLLGSKYESVKEGTHTITLTPASSYELPKSSSISMGNNYPTNLLTGSFNYITPRFLQPNGYTASIVNPHSGSISMVSSIIHLSSSKAITRLKTEEGISLSGSIVVFPKTGSIDYASIANKSFVNIHDTWGTSSADTQFINYASTGSYGTFNIRHIDTRFHFYSIGDTEYYSASNSSNFSNSNNFYNRLIIDTDFHSSVSYESLIGVSNTNQTGRMMGKTRYFSSSINISSSGQVITTDFYPRNHVSKFSNPFKKQMYDGAQNTNPGRLNFNNYEDFSTSSFYSVKVTGGENELIVRGQSEPTIGSNNRIIYD